jgi:hypothetical protein
MSAPDDVSRYWLTLALTAPAALVVWLVFHAMYAELTLDASAVGYVDSSGQMSIFFAYLGMVAGTSVLAAAALLAAVRLLLAWWRRRKS